MDYEVLLQFFPIFFYELQQNIKNYDSVKTFSELKVLTLNFSKTKYYGHFIAI